MAKNSKNSKLPENFSNYFSGGPAEQTHDRKSDKSRTKKSQFSLKISKKLLRQVGGKIPSIYETQRGDLYCTHQKKKIYLGRDPEQARTKVLEMLIRESRSFEPDQTPRAARRPKAQPRQIVEPEAAQPEPEAAPEPPTPPRLAPEPVGEMRVTELVLRYLSEFTDKTRFHAVRTALKVAKERYGDLNVEDFGPLALKDCREQFIAADYARRYINDLTGYIVQMFKFGVANELVSESTAARLTYVKPLKLGEARDNPPRLQVADTEILKTLPYLLPTIRDMVILQRISGMRPSEVFRMTLEQFVKRDAEAWVYVPFHHKTKIHNKSRVIGFGRYEIAILERHARNREPDELMFTPVDSYFEAMERRGAKNPQLSSRVGKEFTKDCYLRNIARTIKRANEKMREEGRPASDLIQHWSPYQLRHATATFISLLMGQQEAATALGHASTRMTRTYDHSEVEKTLKFIKERDKTCGEAIHNLISGFN